MEAESKDIMLKFGSIKYADYSNSPEGLKLSDEGAPDVEIIKAFKGNFWFWWEQRYGTREEAIHYVENYGK